NVAETPSRIVGGNGVVLADMDGAIVGQLWTMDPDADPSAQERSYTYTVSDSRFEVTSDRVLKLKAGQSLPASTPPIPLSVTSMDSKGLSVVQKFTVTISAVPEDIGAATIQFSADRSQTIE